MRTGLKYTVILVAFCLLFATVYFVTKQDRQETESSAAKNESLEERVLGRWGRLIEGDLSGAYQYETPGYRSVYTEPQYRAGFGGQVGWLAAKVVTVKKQDDIADVTTIVKYKAILPGRLGAIESEREVAEKWLKEGDQWFHTSK